MQQPDKTREFLHTSQITEMKLTKTDENYQTVENMSILEIVSKALPKCYCPLEYLGVEKVIVPFKGRVVFKQYFPKNTNILA
jgi:hypothetical protein